MKQITIASIVQVSMFGFMLLSFLTISNLFADEMVHQFKNPSFSGIGTSSHYLTMRQLLGHCVSKSTSFVVEIIQENKVKTGNMNIL